MTICPCCKDTLLRSIYHKQIIWFCPSCRQEMPNITIPNQSQIIQEDLGIINITQETLSNILSCTNANLPTQNALITDLSLLKSFIIRGKLRLYIVDLMIAHLNNLVMNAIADGLSLKNKVKSNRHKVACLYDGQLILHCIIYSFLIGDISIIEHYCLNKLKHTYITNGIPFDNITNFIESLKNRTIFLLNQVASEDLKSSFEKCYASYSSLTSELATYFDFTVVFLSSS